MNSDIIDRIISSNKIGHAYMIECQNYDDSFNFAFNFATRILTLGLTEEEKKSACLQIESKSHPDLTIIYPENRQIKKSVIHELQQKFNKKSYTFNKRVYIIVNCEFLNKEATNSMLKFLEEPSTDLIAILTTSNINKVYDTIKSRCQIININSIKSNDIYDVLKGINISYSNILSSEPSFVDKVCEFAILLEKIGCDVIAENTEWYKILSDRNTFSLFFDVLYYLYYDIINLKLSRNLIYFNGKINSKFFDNKSLNNFTDKIDIIVKHKKLVENNVNVSNLLDKFIIDMVGVDIDDRCSRN